MHTLGYTRPGNSHAGHGEHASLQIDSRQDLSSTPEMIPPQHREAIAKVVAVAHMSLLSLRFWINLATENVGC